MERWYIKGERAQHGNGTSGVVRWKWQRLNSGGEVIEEGSRTFEDISRCMNDARKHGYCARTGRQRECR